MPIQRSQRARQPGATSALSAPIEDEQPPGVPMSVMPGVATTQMTALQASGGNLAMIQLSGGDAAASVHQAAAHGVSGGGGELPHAGKIQAAFGHHDVSNVQAHVGGRAAEASQAMGAEAYATGSDVAFASQPTLHTAAHEAAHVVQQRAGVSLAGGVGRQGDSYEQHADKVADAVVAGESAAPILDQMAGGGGSGGLQYAVQRHEHGTEEEEGAPHVDSTPAPSVQEGGEEGGPMQAEAARELLQDAFGAYTTISAGSVVVLAQAEFQEAFDAIYGNTPYSWDPWVLTERGGNLNGFEHEGVNYINQDCANITTVPHEMLHGNAASDWRPFVGTPFDEGATEYLEQHALRHGGIETNLTHYPNEKTVVVALVASGVSDEQLFTAYLSGGAPTIIGTHVDTNCTGSWSEVKARCEASDWAAARALLETS